MLKVNICEFEFSESNAANGIPSLENLFKLGVTSGSPPKAPTTFAGKLSQRIKMTLGLEVFKIESVFAVKS